MILIAVIFYATYSISTVQSFEDEDLSTIGEEWDLDGPCQPYIHRYAYAEAEMVRCAGNFSSPPKVCTNCIDQFIAMKQIEYELHHLENVTSMAGSPCSKVVYSNYLISYHHEIAEAITRKIWDSSRCNACINIDWRMQENNTEYAFHNNTILFQTKLFAWRHCVANYSWDEMEDFNTNYSAVCKNCLPVFDSLFDFYWDSYVNPDVDFCLDVETTMNDTMNLWHNVWRCSEDKVKDREHDWTFVLFSFAMLTSVTFFFYVGSYVQSERSNRHLVQYSRLEAPHGARSRILSSSNFLADGVNPSTSATSLVST